MPGTGPARPAAPGPRPAPGAARAGPPRRHPGAGPGAARPGRRAGAPGLFPDPSDAAAWPRPSWTSCRRTRPGPSASWPTTGGARPRPPPPTSRSATCSAARCSTPSSGDARRPGRSQPEELQRIRDMVADLNAMLEADARGRTPPASSRSSWSATATCSPRTRSLEELVDALARRAAAASRLAASLTPEQRAELAALSESVLGDLGLQYELDRLGRSAALAPARPALGAGRGHGRRAAAGPGRRHHRPGGAGRPRVAGVASASATRAPPWTTSTWRRWSGPWAGRPSTTSRPCAGWSGADRAGLPGPRAGRARSSAPRRSAASARSPCAASSPASTRAAAATTTSPASAWPASPPAPPAPGSSATRDPWMP